MCRVTRKLYTTCSHNAVTRDLFGGGRVSFSSFPLSVPYLLSFHFRSLSLLREAALLNAGVWERCQLTQWSPGEALAEIAFVA